MDSIKILIVDDNYTFVEVMKKTLESKGCIVRTADNNKDGLKIALNEIIHVAFIDYVLLSEKGSDLVEKIRKYLGRSVDVVMMSGIISEQSVSNYISSNEMRFFKKPINNSDIEEIITKTKTKLTFGSKNEFLLKIFDNEASANNKLKHIISFTKTKGIDFLYILSFLLNSKEKGSIDFSIDKTGNHTLYFENGNINGYISSQSEEYLNLFVEEEFLTKKEIEKLKNLPVNEVHNQMIKSHLVSPSQITEIQLKMFYKVLKKLTLHSSPNFKIKLFHQEEQEFPLHITLDEISDFLLQIKEEAFVKSIASTFNQNILNFSFQFKKDNTYPASVQPFVDQFKQGLRLKDFKNKDTQFYKSLFYILIKGGVYFSSAGSQLKYFHIGERYRKLYQLLNEIDSRKLFKLLRGQKKMNLREEEDIISAYKSFISFNHVDKLPRDLPADTIDIINKVSQKVRYHHDVLIDPKLKEEMESVQKDKEMKWEINIIQQKKACKQLLENKKYKSAADIIKDISEEIIEKDIIWQLLYLWLGLSKEDLNIDPKQMRIYMQNVNKNRDSLRRQYMYHYILGLYYQNNGDNKKALNCYERVKHLDPSFKTVYEDIKKLILIEKTNKKSEIPFLKILSNLKNSKKAG